MDNEDTPAAMVKPAQRLCSEIQLFDLCDLESCTYKEGRFCSNEELLERFEQIADEDERTPVGRMVDELDDDVDADERGFGDFETGSDEELDDEWDE